MKEVKPNQLLRLWTYLRPYRFAFFGSLFSATLQSILNVLEPFILGLAITELSNNAADILRGVPGAAINYSFLGRILLVYFIRALVYQLSILTSQRLMTNAVQNAMRDLRRELAGKINRLPVSYFDTNAFGDVLNRVTSNVDSIANAMQQSLLQIFNAVLGITFAFIMMLIISLKLTLVIVVMIPTAYFVARKITEISQPYFRGEAKYLGQMNGYVQENLTGFSIIKLYGKEEDSFKEFQEINHNLQENGFRAAFISGMMSPLTAVVANGAYIVIAVLGVLDAMAGRITIGNIQAVTQYVWQINQPISIITQLSSVIQAASASTQRVFEFLDEEEEVLVTEPKRLPRDIQGEVSFENVSFSYDKSNPLIKNFNVRVNPGDTVAIVGPTGAGKTTMINLLMRFYDVDSGAIKLDGEDIRSYSRADYRSLFGMVLQDAWLYQDTIEENIRFGNLAASDEEVRAAAKAANVDHFIQTLGQGYGTVINQEASNISLGQKQLLTIARTFIANPKILILDEATSSVDTRLEMLIQKAMTRIMKGRTSFVIAHRLSTIRDADLILVMNQGEILEQGTHEALLEKKGFYHDLYHSQFQNN